jgi:imidazolonepropionase-like amidohydrolase
MQALQSTTFNPARFLAELDKFPVVETGHAADLVLPEANPLAPNLTPSSPRSLPASLSTAIGTCCSK